MKHMYHKDYTLGYFFLAFVCFFMLSFGVLYYVESEVITLQDDEVIENEKRVVAFQESIIHEAFGQTLSDLMYLKKAYSSHLITGDYKQVEEIWRFFSDERVVYDQIRFIDSLGNEKVRVNYHSDGSQVIDTTSLQNKKDRYYFIEASKLEEDKIYVSPLDLNVERGEIEQPIKPMVRLCTPIYNEGELVGVIVLNYKAAYFLDDFDQFSTNSLGQVVLLNEEGFWLSNELKDKEWTFMYPDLEGHSFASENQGVWHKILMGNYQFVDSEVLYTINSVGIQECFNVDSEEQLVDDVTWYIVSSVKTEGKEALYEVNDFMRVSENVLRKNSLFFVMILLISIIVSVSLNLTKRNYMKIRYLSEYDEMTQVLNRRAGLEKVESFFDKNDQSIYPISLCYLDVNGLKEVNDRLGHHVGDELLKRSVAIIKSVIRRDDFIIRLGGDEFLLVFIASDLEVTERVWSRILSEIDTINKGETRPYLISISHGTVEIKEYRRTIDELIKEADEKMYQEKKTIKSSFKVLRK